MLFRNMSDCHVSYHHFHQVCVTRRSDQATIDSVSNYNSLQTSTFSQKNDTSKLNLITGDQCFSVGWMVWVDDRAVLKGIPDEKGGEYDVSVLIKKRHISIDTVRNNDEVVGASGFSIKVIEVHNGVRQYIKATHDLSVKDFHDLSVVKNEIFGKSIHYKIEKYSRNLKNELNKLPSITCDKAGTHVTRAIIAFEQFYDGLNGLQKIELLESIAEKLALATESLSLKPLRNLEIVAAESLVSSSKSKKNVNKEGKQLNNQKEQNSYEERPLVSVQWNVGCGSVDGKQMEILVKMEDLLNQEDTTIMGNKYQIRDWFVINYQPPNNRMKRASRRQKHKNRNQFKMHDVSEGEAFAPEEGEKYRGENTYQPIFKEEFESSGYESETKDRRFEEFYHEVYANKLFSIFFGSELFEGSKRAILTDVNEQELKHKRWLEFDGKWLKGFPLKVSDHTGEHQFLLIYETTDGSKNIHPLRIRVLEPPLPPTPNHQFEIKVIENIRNFLGHLKTRLLLFKKISSAFGDEDASNIALTKIEKGSLMVGWANSSLSQEVCDEESLKRLLKMFLNEQNEITENFRKALSPYIIKNATFVTDTSCASFHNKDDDTHPPGPVVIATSFYDTKTVFFLIIGLILATAVIVLLVCFCCLCYCQKRKKQKESERIYEPNLVEHASTKGVPVIFASEIKGVEKEEEDRKSSKEGTPLTRSLLRSSGRQRSENGDPSWEGNVVCVPPPDYHPPRPGSRDATLRLNNRPNENEPLIIDTRYHSEHSIEEQLRNPFEDNISNDRLVTRGQNMYPIQESYVRQNHFAVSHIE